MLTKQGLMLSLALILTLGQSASADEITYYEHSWDETNKALTTETKQVDATPLSSVYNDDGWMGLYNGWYYVNQNISIKTLNILGNDVKLILNKDYTLYLTGGVKLESPNKLTIYSNYNGEDNHLINLNSNCETYEKAAGIGSGGGENVTSGELVIHGGYIKTIGGEDGGAGIGGGEDSSQGGSVVIYGGEIEAYGRGSDGVFYNSGGAGIGGGENGHCSSVIIYGGTVKAFSRGWAAGIGGGINRGIDGSVIINGGTVEASGQDPGMTGCDKAGAGIGGGTGGSQGGKIEINGGKVTAKGGKCSAGIGGGGYYGGGGNGGEVIITGGEVTAIGGVTNDYESGAGIGGGYHGNGGSVTITGGNVKAFGGDYAAGIGGGSYGLGGNVTICNGPNNASVHAEAGQYCANGNNDDGSAIGCGWKVENKTNSEKAGNLQIGTLFAVQYSTDATNYIYVLLGDQQATCRSSRRVKIAPCIHPGIDVKSRTVESHYGPCKYCFNNVTQEHNLVNGKCTQCECIIFNDSEANGGILEENNTASEVFLSGRKLYKDGHWNTLCLPFDVDLTKQDGPLYGATAKTLVDASFDETTGTLNLIFTSDDDNSKITRLQAGVPYIIKWANTNEVISNPSFKNINFSKIYNNVVFRDISFVGTFDPYNIPQGGDNTILYLGAEDKLYYPNDAMTIGAFRSFFGLTNGLTAGTPTSETRNTIRTFNLDFGDETSSIQQLEVTPSADVWYDINGLKLDAVPSIPGIYIHNGRKVLIK